MTPAPHRPEPVGDSASTTGWQRIGRDRQIAWAIAATLGASLLAITLQQYDIRVSAVFYEPGQGFPVSREPFFIGLRTLGRVLPGVVIAALVILLAIRMLRRKPWAGLPDRAMVFLGLCFALGPGLLVNLILKSNWGRARPIATNDFGGTEPFTPAWWPWGGCHANCSFVSGEASTAIVLLAFAFVAPRAWRPAIAGGTILWTVIISLNRVAFGAHYLSDVVIATCLTLLVMFVLKAVILDPHETPPPPSSHSGP